MEIPDPHTSPAMRELAKFVQEWAERHKLNSAAESHMVACFLAGRLDVGVAMERVKGRPALNAGDLD